MIDQNDVPVLAYTTRSIDENSEAGDCVGAVIVATDQVEVVVSTILYSAYCHIASMVGLVLESHISSES